MGRFRVIILAGVGAVLVGAIALLAYYNRPATEPLADEGDTATATALTTTLFAENLEAPTAIVSTPTSSFLYVTEQIGRIRIVKNGDVEDEPLLDISDKTKFRGEMGLLGLAFHPDFVNDRRIFVNYTNKNNETVIASFTVNSPITKADPASEKAILKYAQPFENHNGGDLQFGPDGYLYIASGDGGSANDPLDNGQDLTSYLGKILRIDINTGDPYSVPTDNPFVKRAGVKKEIWAYGLRNPWRFSFDRNPTNPATADVWIADVGQGSLEEVNFVAAGTKSGINFGWRCYEGKSEFDLSGCGAIDHHRPIVEYQHKSGRCSVTGGYVYRGQTFPGLLGGQYIYGDYCTGEIFSGKIVDGKWVPMLALDTKLSITTFGLDSDGEIYVADADKGAIYQIGAK